MNAGANEPERGARGVHLVSLAIEKGQENTCKTGNWSVVVWSVVVWSVAMMNAVVLPGQYCGSENPDRQQKCNL